jgi:NitT/TauT family transport system permease protein
MRKLTIKAAPVWRPGKTKAVVFRLMPLVLLLLFWQLGSRLSSAGMLPSPLAVLTIIGAEARSGALFLNMAITLARVAASFALAMVLGTALGVAMGRNKTIDRLCDPLLIVLLNLPALVVIVLAYIWVGLNEAAAIGAVALNKLPNTAVTLREGSRALDKSLDEMARVFGLPLGAKARHVVLPQLVPYLAAAMRSGLSLVWKIVLVVELLGRSNGVGFEIGIAFQLFDVTRLLAYALPFVGLMLAIETLIVQPFERHISRWRPPHGA